MKSKAEIAEEQKAYIDSLKQKTVDFLYTIDKSQIETILLSGAVARGDFFPEQDRFSCSCRKILYGDTCFHNSENKFLNMFSTKNIIECSKAEFVDLTVMRKENSNIKAEDIFGKNEDKNVPSLHSIKRNKIWYKINFIDFVNFESFRQMQIPQRSELLESRILYDINQKYQNELMQIDIWSRVDFKKLLLEEFKYIIYLLGEHKIDRWNRHQIYVQMNKNLNAAIRTSIHCLYYINGLYYAAEDKCLYYSLSLEKIPENYSRIIFDLCTQKLNDEKDYFRRESIFKSEILRYIEQFIYL